MFDVELLPLLETNGLEDFDLRVKLYVNMEFL